MNSVEIMELLHPVINAVLAAVGTVIGTLTAIALKKVIDWIKSKIGENRFNQAMELAKGLYVHLESKYNISGMGETKKAEMQAMLLEKFPQLTQIELDSINEAVWSSFNKEWNEKVDTTKRIDG